MTGRLTPIGADKISPRQTSPGRVAVQFTHAEFSLPLSQVAAFYSADEFIVRSGHLCPGNPLPIEEVRRVLLENLGTASSAK